MKLRVKILTQMLSGLVIIAVVLLLLDLSGIIGGPAITLSALGAMAVLCLIFRVALKKSLQPPAGYIDVCTRAAAGDLTVRAEEGSAGGAETLAVYLNGFLEEFARAVHQVKDVTEKTQRNSSDLALYSQQAKASAGRIEGNTVRLKQKITRLDREISGSREAAESVQKYIADVARFNETQSAAVTESSASIEKMTASINNIAGITEEKRDIARRLENISTDGEQEMDAAIRVIRRIHNSAGVIAEMIEIIDDIAERTDMLSMNAAIEAAHAGEAGKGFAVVADEIRHLAETSGESAGEVGKALKGIIREIEVSRDSTEKTGALFDSMLRGIRDVTAGMDELNRAAGELSTGSSKIFETLSSLRAVSTETGEVSGEIEERVLRITESLAGTNGVSRETAGDIKEIADGISDIARTTRSMSAAAAENSDSVRRLERIIGKFRIDETTPAEEQTDSVILREDESSG